MKASKSPTAISLLAACSAGLLLAGCLKKETQVTVEETPTAAEPAPPAAPTEATAPDHSSPSAVVNTLIKAATAKDRDTVAACFAKNCEGEFEPFTLKTASDEEWTEFCEFFVGAEVTGASGDKVSVTTSSRDESISTIKEGEGWKVVGF